MRLRRLGRLLQVMVLVVGIPMAMLSLQGCGCTCGSDAVRAMPNGGKDGQVLGLLAKPGGKGGNRSGGSKAKDCKCPSTKGGSKDSKGGSSKKEPKKNMKLFGAHGVKVPWSKPVANGSVGGRDWRIDLENPDPGYRKGSLHVQLDNRLGGTRWEYAGGGKFKTADGTKLPNAVQKDIDRRAEDDIRNALKRYLKEPW